MLGRLSGRPWSIARLIVAWIVATSAVAVSAKEVSVATLGSAPAVSGPVALVTVRDRTVLLSPRAAFLLQPDERHWTPLRRELQGGDAFDVVSSQGSTALLHRKGDALRGIEVVDLVDGAIRGRPLPLPAGRLTSVRAAWEDEALLLGGVAADGSPRLYRYVAPAKWTPQAPWPGGAAPGALSVQNAARCVILDDRRHWCWTALAGWRPRERAPGPIVGGVGAAIGQAHILYAAGAAGGAALYSYSVIIDAWARLGDLGAQPVAVAPGRNALVIAAWEGPGLSVTRAAPAFRRDGLAVADTVIIAVYMLAMLGIGLFFYRRADRTSAGEFFLGNRRIPFWAAGLSMFAGTIGSVNYLGYPAKSFETDWQYLMSKATYVGALIVVGLWLAPFLRRLNLVSAYSYLELRFNLAIRLLASGLWVILQLFARMGIILYLPSLAIHSITGVGITACIVTVGVFTILYTALGGMRAVVWTDVVQVFVLMGGALFAIGYIVHAIGWSELVETTRAFDKTRAMNWSLDPKQPTMWTFLALAVLEGILCFPRDQIVMQRVLATGSPKEASWSILTFAAVLLPSAMLFYGIGTALFAFYRARPEALDPLQPIDAVFPTFIGNEQPHGVVGLVVAGVLAAAMGVLSGIINSVATLLSVDFYERFQPARTQQQIVRFSEIVSIGVGVVGIAVAILLSRMNVHSLLDLTIELGGVFGGSFAGAYPLGILTRRANWQGAAIGILVSSALTLTAWALQLFHPYLYLGFAIAVTLGVGYLASLFFPPPSRPLDELTVLTRRRAVARG